MAGLVGEDPPFHLPVFVLTHHERAPLRMLGGNSFTFATGGIHEALDLARQAAGGKDVGLEQVRAVEAPGVTHLVYRVTR